MGLGQGRLFGGPTDVVVLADGILVSESGWMPVDGGWGCRWSRVTLLTQPLNRCSSLPSELHDDPNPNDDTSSSSFFSFIQTFIFYLNDYPQIFT